MIVEILKIGQDWDLQSGSAEQHLLIRLPDGSTIKAAVDVETVDRVVRQSTGAPAPAPTSPPQYAPDPAPELDDGMTDFGGDYAPEPEPASPRPRHNGFNVIRQPQHGPVARVLADEMGYPSNVADPPNDEEDEDPGALQA